jgi:DNA phosphorothioation-associated putative methyltransferase
MDNLAAEIPRHKTAIRRGDFSRPVKCLLRDSLIGPAVSVFDYGCGRGEDLELLAEDGISCEGWDPAYRPDTSVQEADVVNLGYVINVIEKPEERAETVRRAWALCRRLLVVSAQVLMSGRGKAPVEFGDGVLTTRGTFQKFYEQSELKTFLEAEVNAEAIPADIGIYYLFKDESAREQFLANRFRRREILPRVHRKRVSETDRQFQENRELLESLMAATAEFGRLPEPDEFSRSSEVVEKFGSLKRAFALVRRITGDDQWEQIAKRRTEDMLVYLALARFKKRPQFSMFPRSLQFDIRSFFGTYTKACAQADDLLFQAGKADLIDAACKRSTIGKLLPDALYVHRESLPYLEPLLRVYEGCSRAYLGEIEGANLVKINRYSGKVSYLVYPDFEKEPHPALARSVKLNMRTRELECQEFGQGGNPPILHRKETFLHPDHPDREKFARLTAQEEKAGLLDETATIGTWDGWNARLAEKGYALRGHRLVRARVQEPPPGEIG